MHVGLFIDTYYPMVDGVIKVVDNYARQLSKICEVTVFAPAVPGYDDSGLPYEIVRCASLPLPVVDYELPTPHLDPKFLVEIEKRHLDIIHIHSPFSVGLSGINYAKIHRVPVVATLHSQFKQDIQRAVRTKAAVDLGLFTVMNSFNMCDECWAVNGDIEKLFIEEYGLTAPSRVMLNATDHMPVADKAEAARIVNEAYGLSEDETVFLFIGRLNYLKNIDFLARSLKLLKEKGHSFKMLFVGKGQDEESFKKLIKDLDMEDRIILCGLVKERSMLENIYSRAKLFLFPSLYDANSLVQIEAACQGTPAVFLEGARTAATVTAEVNGFISAPTEEAYAAKIEEILLNPAHYEEVSAAAHKDLYRSWETAVKEAYGEYERHICEKANAVTLKDRIEDRLEQVKADLKKFEALIEERHEELRKLESKIGEKIESGIEKLIK